MIALNLGTANPSLLIKCKKNINDTPNKCGIPQYNPFLVNKM
jgi:hypothetical protein